MYGSKLDALVATDLRKGDLTSTTEINPMVFEDLGGPIVVGYDLTDSFP